MFHKGDIIKYNATAEAVYPYDNRGEIAYSGMQPDHIVATPDYKGEQSKCIVRYPDESKKGMLLGKSYRAYGVYKAEHNGSWWDGDYDPATLDEHGRVPVWVVMPYSEDDRYRVPVLVLESDLETLIPHPFEDGLKSKHITAVEALYQKKYKSSDGWAKIERIRAARAYFAQFGWTYENGFGLKEAKEWVETVYSNNGHGDIK